MRIQTSDVANIGTKGSTSWAEKKSVGRPLLRNYKLNVWNESFWSTFMRIQTSDLPVCCYILYLLRYKKLVQLLFFYLHFVFYLSVWSTGCTDTVLFFAGGKHLINSSWFSSQRSAWPNNKTLHMMRAAYLIRSGLN